MLCLWRMAAWLTSVTGQGARGPQFKFETQWSTTLTNEELEIGLDWLSNTNSNEAQQIG